MEATGRAPGLERAGAGLELSHGYMVAVPMSISTLQTQGKDPAVHQTAVDAALR